MPVPDSCESARVRHNVGDIAGQEGGEFNSVVERVEGFFGLTDGGVGTVRA